GQRLGCPAAQNSQWPHPSMVSPATRVPSHRGSTPSPRAVTVPLHSCPSRRGWWLRALRRSSSSASNRPRSVPQMPVGSAHTTAGARLPYHSGSTLVGVPGVDHHQSVAHSAGISVCRDCRVVCAAYHDDSVGALDNIDASVAVPAVHDLKVANQRVVGELPP